MILAQGRYWRASLGKGSGKGAGVVTLQILRDALPEELEDYRDLRIEVPYASWNRVAKHLRSGRKLLGGILLDFAKDKERLSGAIGNDRLYIELQRVALEATIGLVEAGAVTLVPASEET